VGVATSQNVEGPYTPMEKPFVCPDPSGRGSFINSIASSSGMGGAIDASGFRDIDGSRYVIYKVDGNSLVNGGPCGNGGSDPKPTPLMMVKVAGDGITPLGRAIQLLDRWGIDGPLIEAPNLTRLRDGSYALLFSSNCWNTPLYDISWARAPKVTGPYQRQPLILKTGMSGLKAPGGASVSNDGTHMVFHADHPGGRAMFAATISQPGMVVHFTNV
jgi:beta-xylosidase